MNQNRVSILGTHIDNLTMEETIKEIEIAINDKKQIHHVVVNAGKIVSMQADPDLKESVNSADIINADGQAVVWASRLLKKPLKERVAGIDLFINLIKKAHEKNHKIFLLGAKQEIVEKVQKRIASEFSINVVAGYANGYFEKEDEEKIIKQIVDSAPQMLFVAMTSPHKEMFLYRNREALKQVNFIMGVGGSFDVYSGKIKRAPILLQKIGMEWFFRLIQDPARMWKRYLVGNSKFITLVFKERFLGNI
ncbi:WecB/TagA/CpsF family glycosyltransferase [Flavobacterium sp. CYK-55]|uniref:WecB/TagA/CpsF family glycosyltransferase n=1 Tax=Flavobacterium sp. CYK-55 TaxID=2835529 RepID=UPI001BCC0C9B|nr:WecB/TagA/CpsF family glycosyltransferase [Flavobacterium sp. CYK-55]MBS7787524.1 WecB/TagA/CpsF family glycosyltransferase [Flavobacterium sp. CYK-55]